MGQMQTIGRTATTVQNDDGVISVTYHNTEVVRVEGRLISDQKVTLNTGGYFTNTTKTRMNQTSQQFALGFYVYQKDYDWYVARGGRKRDLEFKGNRLTFKR